jgi:hypothetical protein
MFISKANDSFRHLRPINNSSDAVFEVHDALFQDKITEILTFSMKQHRIAFPTQFKS